MLKEIKIVFIACNGRSGSTLLQSIFDSHPNICAPIESKFVLHLATKYLNITNWNKKIIAQFCEDLYTNRKFRLFWNVQQEELLKLFSKYEITCFQDACKVVYLSYPSGFEKQKIKVIVDKNPVYARFLNQLNDIFPDARFIHLVRDPRSVYFSQLQKFSKKWVYDSAISWRIVNRFILDFKENYPNRFYTITYENLVKSPENEMQEIYTYLNLRLHIENMGKRHKVMEKTAQKNAYLNLPHHQNVGKPITAKNVEKWKGKLSEKKVKIIETLTYDIASDLGYKFKKHLLPKNAKFKKRIDEIKLSIFQRNLNFLFSFPFYVRKKIFGCVGFFFDGKYKKFQKSLEK